MGGIDSKRLALIHSTFKGPGGKDKHISGTGYLVTDRLVLTARHVLSAGPPDIVEVRLEKSSKWIEADKTPVWEHAKLDAALIKVTQPVEGLEPLAWGELDFEQNQSWESVAYPRAASIKGQDGSEFKTSGLEGTLYAHGGGGQGLRELDLGVEHEAEVWSGISGAPVFVDEKLVGIIKSDVTSFKHKRLAAVPVSLLLRDPSFRTAIAPKWLPTFPQTSWVLVLLAESGESELADVVQVAIKKQAEETKRLTGQVISYKPLVVKVTEALESPERLFQFLKAIAAAPIMVVDVTGFEPAVMLFLGVRAVARRGVTITTINNDPDETFLSQLPFNIQETKLIYLSNQYDIDSPKHAVNRIGSAIQSGLMQLKADPSYLDLPAYDAVRSPEPTSVAGMHSVQDKILMLCPFKEAYKEHWLYVSDKIIVQKDLVEASLESLERMLDIASPRLVGQALYEAIRWTRCCVVDWSHWRANVFFELGVRYACSDIGPICLIEEEQRNLETTSPIQRERLFALLDPVVYKLNDRSAGPFKKAFARYVEIINRQEVPLEHRAIAHNAIYQTILDSYYWAQEPITRLPHEEMRANLHSQFGSDPQKKGTLQVLFSSNPEFAKELNRNVQERWIAAWAYARSRYSLDEFHSNEALRSQLIALGEEVLQMLSKSADPNHKRISKDILDVIDDPEFYSLRIGSYQKETLLQAIRELKTKAKNRRDLKRYENAVAILERATPLIKKELSSATSADGRAELASELSDCFGLLGGIYRRWGLESQTDEERALYLKKSVDAYKDGYDLEKVEEYHIADSYNLLNRLVSYILLKPEALRPESTDPLIGELEEAEATTRDQLREKRRGDIWALADLALVKLLLDKENPVQAYADFMAGSPPDYAYESTLSVLRPLAELQLPVAGKLKEAVQLMETRLKELKGSSG